MKPVTAFMEQGLKEGVLLEAGFEWIDKDETGLTYFRKRKRQKQCVFRQ